MNLDEVIFIDNLPTIDLHGFDRDYASIKINEFIKDNKKIGNSIIVIIHGVGSGILRKQTEIVLKRSKDVIGYKLFYRNIGATIVKIKV